jgi:hypothetical protein
MATVQNRDIPLSGTLPLSQALETHARLESLVGEIYMTFAFTFAQNPELRDFWGGLAMEEGGHAALAYAASIGLLSGILPARPILFPAEEVHTLTLQVQEFQRRAQAGVSLNQALRITWELEQSELEFLLKLLTSASNVAQLGFPTNPKEEDTHSHLGRVRTIIQRHATDEGLRRKVKFLAAEHPPR